MDQLSIDDVYDNNIEPDKSTPEKTDIFGCCYRYRECSDAKKCLYPDTIDYENCAYKQNLENGNIFYGKNAGDFDIDIYRSFIEKYNNLDDDTRYVLDCIIIYHQKPFSSFLWYNSNAVHILIEQGFVVGYVPKKQILTEYVDIKYLKTLLDRKTKDTISQFVKKREKSKNARAKKADIVKYLMDNPVASVDNYVNQFISISIPTELNSYYAELYHDLLVSKRKQYTFKVPRESEQTFLKSTLIRKVPI